MGKLSVEQGDRPPAATGPGKNRCGGPTAVGMASWGSPGRLSHRGPTALGSGARGRGERRLPPENEDATEIQTPAETVVIWEEADRHVPALRSCCRHGEKELRVGRHF